MVDFQVERVQLRDRASHGRGRPVIVKCRFSLRLLYAGPHRLGTLPGYCSVPITPPQGIEQMRFGRGWLESLSQSRGMQLLYDLDKGVDPLREPTPV
ncbi:hypothetical protein J7I97_18035 [Streptomyces sp. ISL-87]|nr:hypothetical protein [Streptomyces sp. ISL-87]